MTGIDKDWVAEFALLHYRHEGGTKRAVDDGRMTLQELTIHHYVDQWVNEHADEGSNDALESLRRWREKLPEGIAAAAQEYKISELEAKTIYDKVHAIPRVEQTYLEKYGERAVTRTVDYERAVSFAKSCYEFEPGRRKAIDDGRMTLEELSVYKYIITWTNEHTPQDIDAKYETSMAAWRANLPQGIAAAAKDFRITELEAQLMYEKVREIPRALPREE